MTVGMKRAKIEVTDEFLAEMLCMPEGWQITDGRRDPDTGMFIIYLAGDSLPVEDVPEGGVPWILRARFAHGAMFWRPAASDPSDPKILKMFPIIRRLFRR